MLHKIFAHTSQESPKSGSRSRLFTALLLTVTVLLGLSFSGVAYAKAANNPSATVLNAAKGHGQAKPSHGAPRKPLGVTKRQSQFKAQAHPNTGLSAEFVDFSYDPSYSPNFSDTIGIAVDYLGDVYVADIGTNTIYMETPIAGGGFTQSVVASGFEELYAIAVDSNLNVYASDYLAGTVYIEVPNAGTYTQSVVDSTLVSPTGLAIDAYGDVFVADTVNGLVEEVNNGGGSYTANSIYGGFFDSPNAVAVDSYGNLYVGDYIYQLGFSVLYSLPNYGGGTYGTPVDISDDFYGIDAIAVANNGTLYVTDAGLFDDPAVYTMIPSQQGGYNQFQLTGTEVEYPFGGALDSLGNFYTTDLFGDFVLIISNNFGALPVGSSNSVNGPVQVNFVIDGAGTLGPVQVTTQGEGSLDFFNAGAASDSCSGAVFTAGGFCSVTLGFAPSVPGIRTGGVVLTDNTSPVGVFLATSEAFSGIGIAPRASFLPGTFSYITGAYTYAKQAPNFAEAREKAHLKVPKTSPHGAAKAMQISALSNYPGYEPDGIVVDSSGNYFVADQYYCAIFAYFPNSAYNLANPDATEWVSLPLFSELCPSGGLAVDGSGNVFYTAWYTADNGAVIAYDINEGYDTTLGENTYSSPEPAVIYTNTGSGIPYYINNLTVDAYDNIYFTGSDDSYADAYAYVAPSASYFYQYGFPPDYFAVSELPGTYDYLTGISADDYGDVVISDYDLGEVFAYIPESNGTYYSYELARGLDTPVAVDIDPYENVFVLDSGDDTGISALYLAVGNGGVGEYQGGPTNGFNLIPLSLSYYYDYGDAYYFNFGIDSDSNFYLTDDGYWGGLITQIDVNDPPSLSFETTDIGLISVDSPQVVFLLDTGNDVLTLPVPASGFNPSISTDFLLNTSYYGYFPGGQVPVSDCPLIAAGGTSATISEDNACALPVSFAPLPPAGTDSGTLVVTDDSLYGSSIVPLAKGATRMVKTHASVPLTKGGRLAKGIHPLATTAVAQTIDLTGIGVDFFTIDFTVTGGGVPPIVKAGGSLAVQIVVAPVAPVTVFPLPVTLSAGGGPQGSSYTFVPAVIPAGAGSTTVTLTINIPIDYVAKNDAPAAPGQNNHTKLPVAPLALALLLLPMAGKLRKAGKRMSRMAALMLLAIAGITATATLIGCGANKAAVYEITVTGTSGILSHSTSFDITVEGR
jgi:large repetitive protein